jgi:hypothetical protein
VLPGRQPFLTSAPSAPTAGLRRRRRNTSQLGEQFHGYASLPAPTAALSDGHASPGCGCRWVGFLFVDLPWEGLAAFRAGQLDTWMMRRCFRSLRIVLNAITFQRTWQIPPPPTGLWISGRGLVSSRMRSYRQRQRRQWRSVRIELAAAEIDALVKRGYLDPKNRDDLAAIGEAATAFISDALFGM